MEEAGETQAKSKRSAKGASRQKRDADKKGKAITGADQLPVLHEPAPKFFTAEPQVEFREAEAVIHASVVTYNRLALNPCLLDWPYFLDLLDFVLKKLK